MAVLSVGVMHQRTDAGDEGATLAMVGQASADIAAVLASPEAWRLSSRELISGVDAAYRLATQAHTVALLLVGELDARGLATEAGATSTAAWLGATRRMRPQEAKRDVTVAQLLRGAADRSETNPQPVEEPAEGTAVRAGLSSGEMSVDQAGAIATALLELPDDASVPTRVLAERLLAEEAHLHGPAALTRLGHRIAERVDPDAADRAIAEKLAREEREARRLRSGTRFSDGHGSVFYKFRVPVGDDAFIWPVLDALSSPEPAGEGVDDTDPRSPKQRLADAFVEAMRRVGLDGGLPTKGGDRPRIVLNIDLDHLTAGVGYGTIVDTGDQLDPGTVRRLACDAQVIPQVLAGPSQLLDQGRASRTAQGPLRLAVISRDRGCVHPGCTRPPRWCDVHHVVPWWAGGATDLANLVLLCGYHHRLYDTGDWGLKIGADGVPDIIPPAWIDAQQRSRRHERFYEMRAP